MEDDTETETDAKPKKHGRDAELSKRKDIREQAIKICETARKAFEGQNTRNESAMDHWDAFNTALSDRQFYHGTSTICTPFVRDAVLARQTRFSGQLFPENQKHIEAIGHSDTPYALISLLEHYIRQLKLKINVVDPLLVNGDLEGQYNLFVSWEERTRHVTSRIKAPIEDDGEEIPEDIAPPVDDMEEEEEVIDSGPCVEVLSDADVVVFPATSQSIEQALENGGGVAIIRRWTKGEVEKLKARGEITKGSADAILDQMSNLEKTQSKDITKAQGEAAGVKISRGAKVAVVYDLWCKLKVEGERRICRILWGGEDIFLSIKRNPYWCDRVPVLSCAVDKTSGVFKGRAPAAAVLDFHILANDTVNEGADSGHFSLLPIIMSDPAKNPKLGSMVLAPAAVWETDPASTMFAQFPDMWKDAVERVLGIRSQIFQTLSVNPSMIPGTTGGKNRKMNQAEIAQEQAVDLITTADAVMVLEEGILSPLLTLILEFDHQFRKDNLLIRALGPVGRQVHMEELEPQQIDRKVEFRWFGVEAAKSAAKLQQQIAGVNVLRGIPPQAYPGYKLNLAPVISQMVENLFGPIIAPEIFSEVSLISVDPNIENEMMVHGFDVEVHPGDNDMQHLQAHMQALQGGDPHGTVRKHMMLHQKQAVAKATQQHAQSQGQQPQEGGGGPLALPGPQPGGQPRPPQSQPGAPGQIHPDQMARAGSSVPPRK